MGKMIDKLKEDLSVLDRHLARQDEEIAELKTTNANMLAALEVAGDYFDVAAPGSSIAEQIRAAIAAAKS